MDPRAEHMAKRFEIPMLVASALVIPAIILHESAVSPGLRTFADVIDIVIWLAFLAEAAAILYVSSNRRRWLLKHPLEAAIILFTGPFLPASLQAARALRILRVLRVLRLVPSARRVFSLDGVRIAGVLTLLVVLAGGAAFHTIENTAQGRHVSLWDGVWWAIATVTTVTYGEIRPHSTGGRIVGIAVMFSGIGFVALLTAAAAQRFLTPQVEEIETREEQVETDIATSTGNLLRELRDIASRITEIERHLSAEPPRPAGAEPPS
jgi:voltage-gated potassium channel